MAQLGPLLSPLLVGRDDLLDLAERRIAEAASGRGQLILLAGEAGIGKTRLMRSILRKAEAAGFRIAQGDLSPQDRLVPLASILDLARTMRESTGFGSLGEELLEMRRRDGGDTLGARRMLVRDLADAIVASADRPTLLAFEDLQWADEVSLEVIGELARLVRERPVLLVGSYRIDELPVDSVHREWRARLLSQRLAEEARLAPLTYEQTALVTTLILATGLPAPREVVSAVYERTDGIPLHVEELLGALGDAARADGRAIRNADVPDTIEDAILARVSRMSEDAQAVARAGAVVGRCFVPDVLAGVMDRQVGDLEAALDELVANSVLYPFQFVDQGYFDFRHQLLRDALYESVPTAELRGFHARAAEFGGHLVGNNEIHASVHFERAGLRAEAYRAALAGAEAAAAMSSRNEAFELYARAAANAPDDLPTTERIELYQAYCDAAFAVDDVPVAEESAMLLRRYALEAGMPIEAAGALISLANLARRDVRSREDRLIVAQADAELEALPASPDRNVWLSDAKVSLAVLEIDTGRLDAAAALLVVARQLRLASDDQDCGDIDFVMAQIEVYRGHVDAGLETMLETARASRDARLESTGVTAYRTAAAIASHVMDYGTAAIGLREGLRYAGEIEQSYCRHVMAAVSAHVAWAEGRWDEAIAVAEIELVERGSRRGTLGSRDALGYVAFGRGEVERARSLLEASLEIGRRAEQVELLLPPMWGLAETALVAGDAAAAIVICEDALAIGRSSGMRAFLVPFVVTGVRAYLAAHRPDDAERWSARVNEVLGDWAGPADIARLHAAGLLHLATGSTVMARTELEEAATRLGGAAADLGGDLRPPRPRHRPAAGEPSCRGGAGPRGGAGGRRSPGQRSPAPPCGRARPGRQEPGHDRRAVAAADRPGVRGRAAGRRGHDQRRDRRRARAVAQDRQRAPRAHPREARRDAPGRGGCVGRRDPDRRARGRRSSLTAATSRRRRSGP